MHPDREGQLKARVVQAAEAALSRQQYVSAIDVLTGMGLLSPVYLQEWRKGQVDYLERVVQGNLKKICLSMSLFREWAAVKGLKPSETLYIRKSRFGTVDLQFSNSGDPDIERSYRTHYVSPDLSQRKQESLEEKLSKAAQPVVFEILRDSQCSECSTELPHGSFLFMEAERPLCLACAGLGQLEYLPSGDAALTRRAAKYSGLTAVVVRFSRSRGRYERQGILVESAALEKAEQECTDDAEDRAEARGRAAVQRRKDDLKFIAQMTNQIRALFPGCPPGEAEAIARHTAMRGSGRVGRTAAARNLEERPLTAAVVAAVRHTRTNYDELLAAGMDRELAREQIAHQVDTMLDGWRQPVT